MAENKVKRKHLVYVDVLNIMSCFAVVMLHVSLNVFNPSDTYWTQAVLFQAIAIFAVPIFFMISGMNLIGYADKYDTKTFLKETVACRSCAHSGKCLLLYLILHIPVLFLWRRTVCERNWC